MVNGEMQTQHGYRMVFNREADLSGARLRMNGARFDDLPRRGARRAQAL